MFGFIPKVDKIKRVIRINEDKVREMAKFVVCKQHD